MSDPFDRRGDRTDVVRRDEQPVLPVDNNLGDPADGSRDHGRPDRKRLEQRVRQVLPRRREQRGVDGPEEREDVVARAGAEKTHAIRDPEPGRVTLERVALGAVAEDEELDVGDAREGFERVAERLLRGEPSRGAEREPSNPERGARLLP